MFAYPNMFTQHSSSAPLALVWVSVEELKRFGLALYKVCRICACSDSAGEDATGSRSELLNLADLEFSMPDSDELWNAPCTSGTDILENIASKAKPRDNRDSQGWITQASSLLYDVEVDFDWI
jgi:hypothetical protein